MAFKDRILKFYDNKIIDSSDGSEVMMNWESPIMERAAEFVCYNKGDILEIGFGMGICADYIQAQNVKSHTIVEIHPQILDGLKEWAEDKSNVTIIKGDWNDILGVLDDNYYDGIFFDTHRDENTHNFKSFVFSKIKEGGRISFYNNLEEEYDEFGFDSTTYEKIPVIPSSNSYTDIKNIYYMPKVQF